MTRCMPVAGVALSLSLAIALSACPLPEVLAGCEPPPMMPFWLRSTYTQTCSQLAAAAEGYAPETRSGLIVGSGVPGLGHLIDRGPSEYRAVIDTMIGEMHLGLLHFSIPLSSTNNPEPYRALLDYARAKGVRTMIIAEELDSDPSWGQYAELHTAFVEAWAPHTDLFMVVSDPTFPWDPACRIRDKEDVSLDDFAELAINLSRRAKARNPGITVLAGLPGHYSQTFPENGVLLDRLRESGAYDAWVMYCYALPDLSEAEKDIADWQSEGRDVWIMPNYATADRSEYYANPWIDGLAAGFVNVTVNYAETHSMPVWDWPWPVFMWTFERIDSPQPSLLAQRTVLGATIEGWARLYASPSQPPVDYPGPPIRARSMLLVIGGLLLVAAIYSAKKHSG